MDRDSGGAVTAVRTPSESIPAELVVNAAGPWARKVGAMVGLDLPVEPHPRQAFGIGPLPQLDPGMPLTVDLGSGAYVHPEVHGGIVGGNDRESPASEEAPVRWQLTESLIDALVHRIPWMSGAELRSGWCGLREMTPDDHAIVGPSEVPRWWNLVGFLRPRVHAGAGHRRPRRPLAARWAGGARPVPAAAEPLRRGWPVAGSHRVLSQ